MAWTAALVAALTGEALDIRDEIRGNYAQPDNAHWKDVWNTMLWPTVLLLTGPLLQPRLKASGDLADQSLEQPPPV